MEVGFSPEQEMLRESARELLASECPMEEVRKFLGPDANFPEALWQQIAELGWVGLQIPEKWGGSGLGPIELSLLQEELGRVLCPIPFASTAIVGAKAILELGNDQQHERLLPALAQGQLRTTLAQLEETADWNAAGIQLSATASEGGYRLTGRKLFVPDAGSAHLLIVPVRTTLWADEPERGVTLLLVDPKLPGVSIRSIAYNEQIRPMSEVTFDAVQVSSDQQLGEVDQGWAGLITLHDHARIALCSEICGAAEQVLQLSVEYAKTREQFGQPIGRFQAVQHRCADMLVRSEGIRSAAQYAAWALEEAEPDVHTTACLAKAYCSQAYREIAGSGIQIHGGLGFTWEQDLHLYFKHALASDFAWGDASHQRELAARQLIDKTQG